MGTLSEVRIFECMQAGRGMWHGGWTRQCGSARVASMLWIALAAPNSNWVALKHLSRPLKLYLRKTVRCCVLLVELRSRIGNAIVSPSPI